MELRKVKAWDEDRSAFVRAKLTETESSNIVDERGFNLVWWTGLRDKNGVEVYEGDTMDQSRFPEDAPCPYSVIFCDGAFRKQYPGWDETLSKPVLSQSDVNLLDDIVIGNIFESHELLEE